MTSIPRPPISAAILAGGAARRMGGVAKELLVVDGISILERQLEVLRPFTDDLLVVGRDLTRYEGLPVRALVDEVCGLGPIGGLVSALSTCRHEALLVVACDMPYLAAPPLELLLEEAAAAPGADAIVPRVYGRPEPLLGIYRRSALAAARAHVQAGRLAMKDLLLDLTVRWLEEDRLRRIDPRVRFLANWNRPEDLT